MVALWTLCNVTVHQKNHLVSPHVVQLAMRIGSQRLKYTCERDLPSNWTTETNSILSLWSRRNQFAHTPIMSPQCWELALKLMKSSQHHIEQVLSNHEPGQFGPPVSNQPVQVSVCSRRGLSDSQCDDGMSLFGPNPSPVKNHSQKHREPRERDSETLWRPESPERTDDPIEIIALSSRMERKRSLFPASIGTHCCCGDSCSSK
jgi:hypothetical protein